MASRAQWMRTALAGLAAAVTLGLASSAAAQDRTDLDVQLFEPALGPHSIFTVQQTGTIPHLKPAGQIVFDYLSAPVVENPDEGLSEPVVDQQLVADALGGIGVTERGQVALHLPLYLTNDVRYGGDDLSGITVGDLTLTPKYQIVSREQSPVGFGAALDVGFPTGNGEAFVGSPSVTAEPKALVDAGFGGTTIAANLGLQFQKAGEIRNIEVGHRFTYRLGVEQEVVDGLLDIGGELYGYTPLADFFGDADEVPLEGILGAKVRTGASLVIMAGGGAGIAPGIGAPEFRAFLGVGTPDKVRDRDGDGIDDGEDECPDEAEDLDGYEDSDGCPDPDNDGDGIPDTEDKCPEKPEDQNGVEDDDGCPDGDKDTDGDGIPDTSDDCVDKPEDEDGFEDDDGCPDPDNDGDGIADAEDECPNKPGLRAQQGCPAKKKKAVRKEKEIKNLEKVFFEYDKAVLKKESYDVLDQIGLILRTNPDIKQVLIVGHTDDIGSKTYNKQLSEQRAKAVLEYLVERQEIRRTRLEIKGMGATKPLVPNNSKKNRQKNRRVEFRIVEQEKPKGSSTEGPAGDGDSGGDSNGDDPSGDGDSGGSSGE